MSEQRVVVMGLGNLLWADEGFGVRVAERLYAHYHWPDEVEIVDGGTQGLNLLGYVESASHLLITGWNPERCEHMPENAFRLISARRK